MMKRHIFTLLALFCVSAYAKTLNVPDSLAAHPVCVIDSSEYTARMLSLEYESILDEIEQKRAKAKRRRKTLPELDPVEAECRRCLQMLKSSGQVLILDSVVVDKRDLLSAYGFGSEVGSVELSDDGSTTSFATERGNMSFRSEVLKGDSTGQLRLVSSYIESGKFVETRQLKGFEMDGDANYPFMMTDGVTFYFAARTEEGLGNYDLYATRYDSESGVFYRPENLGFPFNSYANDYLLVIDEVQGVGWFASDRYQPEGKVCVYTFIPNETRNTIDYENMDKTLVRQKAMLSPIASTWTAENEQLRIKARQRMVLMQSNASNAKRSRDFTLVINDLYTYTQYSDFKSQKATALCREWIKKQEELRVVGDKLDKMRTDYHNASRQKKQSMRNELLSLEQKYEQLVSEVKEAEKNVRNTEIEYLN